MAETWVAGIEAGEMRYAPKVRVSSPILRGIPDSYLAYRHSEHWVERPVLMVGVGSWGPAEMEKEGGALRLRLSGSLAAAVGGPLVVMTGAGARAKRADETVVVVLGGHPVYGGGKGGKSG